MAIKTNIWTPDTCGASPPCTITFTWDDSVAQALRVHTPVSSTKCANHAVIADVVSHWTTLQDENSRKNKTIERARVLFPALFDVNGNFLGSWNLSGTAPNRVLNINTAGLLTAAQISTVQTWSNTNLGAGKVVVS